MCGGQGKPAGTNTPLPPLGPEDETEEVKPGRKWN